MLLNYPPFYISKAKQVKLLVTIDANSTTYTHGWSKSIKNMGLLTKEILTSQLFIFLKKY